MTEMTKFEKLKGIAGIFAKFEKAKDTDPTKFEAVKVKDGETMVEFNPSLEVGSPVMVSSGTGSVPAPDETYTFDSGVSFITKDGLIESVVSDGKAPEKTPEEIAAEAEKKAKEGLSAVTIEMHTELKDEVAALKLALEKANTALETATALFAKLPSKEELTAFNTHLATVGTVIESLSEIAVEEPITKTDGEVVVTQDFEKMAAIFDPQTK